MLFLLRPEEPLSTLEDQLVEDPEGLFEVLNLDTMRKVEVDLLLPRFKIESTVPLKQDLQRLGRTSHTVFLSHQDSCALELLIPYY